MPLRMRFIQHGFRYSSKHHAGERLRVETAAIPACDFRLRMTPQPVGARDDITIFENIDNRATLDVDDDRAVGLRFPPTPIIDPDYLRV